MSKLYDLLSAMCGKIKKPDWNQNDSTAANYVKNRPFYTGDPVETVLVEESTDTFTEGSGGLFVAEFPPAFEATVGEIYNVRWDSTVYECTCADFNGHIVIGNLSIPGAGSDTGEPFLMLVENGSRIVIYTLDTSASHTFSISGIVAPIVKIPAKYIDKNSSGYIAIHSNDIMTEQEAENYDSAIENKEVVFIIWGNLCINNISLGSRTDSTGVSVYYLNVTCINGEIFEIAKNSEGLYDYNDRVFSFMNFPTNWATGNAPTIIRNHANRIEILPGNIEVGVGSTDVLFRVSPNGTKSKSFEVLGNGEAVTQALILYSSTADSTKKFRITVDDTGTISATEVT